MSKEIDYIKQAKDLASKLANKELSDGDIIELVIEARKQRDRNYVDFKHYHSAYMQIKTQYESLRRKIRDTLK